MLRQTPDRPGVSRLGRTPAVLRRRPDRADPCTASASTEAGFTLVEMMIATMVLVTGLVAVAQLLTVSTRMNADARASTVATLQAQTKLEELMKIGFTAASVQVNAADTLSSNVANYFDSPATGVTRRWQVAAGASGTRLVTVRVLNTRGQLFGSRVELTTSIRQW